MRFFNSTQKIMDFSHVVDNILKFINADLNGRYILAVGTDSQVKGNVTCFATGIHVHRVGKGAWCCIKKKVEDRRYNNLKEKISHETVLTYEIITMLNEMLLDSICELTVNHHDFDFSMEAHIDVGLKGESRKLIREMVSYFEGIGVDAKIKPESFVASCYANRYSKNVI